MDTPLPVDSIYLRPPFHALTLPGTRRGLAAQETTTGRIEYSHGHFIYVTDSRIYSAPVGEQLDKGRRAASAVPRYSTRGGIPKTGSE